MGSIGSWYVRSVPSDPDEEVLASFSANYLRADGRPLGGKLYVTSERVVFTPHLIDAWIGGDGYQEVLPEILSVSRTQPDDEGTRDRLQLIDTSDRETQFIVHDLEAARETIDTAVADRLNS